MELEMELCGMEFHAPHGCYATEKKVGNRYLVDLHMRLEYGSAAEKDDLGGALNYLDVYSAVREQMAVSSDIIENVAFRIARVLRDRFPQIVGGSVKVSKMAPPIGGKAERVAVTLSL